MISRMIRVGKFLRGDFVVLSVSHGDVQVDAGNIQGQELQVVASKFFNKVYNLASKKA